MVDSTDSAVHRAVDMGADSAGLVLDMVIALALGMVIVPVLGMEIVLALDMVIAVDPDMATVVDLGAGAAACCTPTATEDMEKAWHEGQD